MFNRELFYALCDKYGVEFSDQYDKPMLKTEDGLRELVEQDVKDIFPKCQETAYYFYHDNNNTYKFKASRKYIPQDLMIA